MKIATFCLLALILLLCAVCVVVPLVNAAPASSEAWPIPNFAGPSDYGTIVQNGRYVTIDRGSFCYAFGYVHQDGTLWLTWVLMPNSGFVFDADCCVDGRYDETPQPEIVWSFANLMPDGSIVDHWNWAKYLQSHDDGTFTGRVYDEYILR